MRPARFAFPRSPVRECRNCGAPIIDAIAPAGRLEQEGGFITSLRHEQLIAGKSVKPSNKPQAAAAQRHSA